MQIQCPRRQKPLTVSQELIGRWGRCPHCHKEVNIPGALAPPPLAMAAGAATAVACPSCGAALRPTDALCVNCGFDRRSGRLYRTVVQAPAARADPRGEAAGAAEIDLTWDHVGSRRMGYLLGILSMLAGGALWATLANSLAPVVWLILAMFGWAWRGGAGS